MVLVRRTLALALLVVLVGPLVGLAGAHATLIGSTPGNDEVVDTAPSEVTLRFDEPVAVDRNSVRVFDPEGGRVEQGEARRSDRSRVLTVDVDDGGRGTYTVSYAVLSEDGHVITGSWNYHVGERTGATSVDDGPRAAAATFAAIGRWIAFAGAFVVAGVVWTALLVTGRTGAPAGPGGGWTGGLLGARRLLLPGAAATLFGTVVALVGRAAELSGRSVDGALAEVPALVTGSRTGAVAGLRVLVALVLLLAVAGTTVLRRAPWLAVVATLATLALPAVGGHASTTSPVVLVTLLEWAHLLAASLWVGGLAVLVLTWSDDGPPTVAERARRYSTLALPSALVTVATGLGRSWFAARSWDAVTTTVGGKLVLAKAAGAVVMLGLGWVHRRWLADRARDVAGLVTGLRTELLVGVAVLAVTAVLVDTRPPVDAVVRPFGATESAGKVDVRIDVTPAASGANEVHLYFLDDKGLPAPVDAYELKVSSGEVEPRRVPMTTITASHGFATGVVLTPGTWDFDLVVVTEGEPSTATFEVPVD